MGTTRTSRLFASALGVLLVLGLTGPAVAAPQRLESGQISGRVSDTEGRPIEGVQVRWTRGDDSAVAAITDADGRYSMEGMDFGDYQLWFFPISHAAEWYDDSADQNGAATVSLSALSPIAGGINAELGPPPTVRGRITNAAGEPVAGIRVVVCDGAPEWPFCAEGSYPDETVPSISDEQGRYEAYAYASGYFSGPYHLIFIDQSGTYMQQFWPGGILPAEAQRFRVEPGEVRDGFDVTMQVPGRIAGRVTDSSGPVQSAHVTAKRFVAGLGWSPLYGSVAQTDSEGRYTTAAMYPGRYRLSFDTSRHAVEYYSDAADVDSADDVRVNGGDTTAGVDVTLESASTILGRVTGRAGARVSGVTVGVSTEGRTVGSDTTDGAGGFSVGELEAGTYDVFFRDESGRYLDRLRTSVRVPRSEVTSMGAVELTPVSGLTGRVVDDRGRPVPGLEARTARIRGGGVGRISYATTDRQGRFDVTGLRSGRYYLWFVDALGNYLGEVWRDASGRGDATTIKVPTGRTVSGIKARVGRAAHIKVRLTWSPGPAPLPAQVPIVMRRDGDRWRKMSPTVSPVVYSSKVTLGGLPPGRYRIGFIDRDARSLGWWKDARKFGQAKVFRLTHGRTVTIRQTLACGGPLLREC